MKIYNLFRYFILLGLLLQFASCSKKSDNEYWNDAVQDLKTGKYKDAVTFFTKVADEYPDSKYASKALFETGKLYQTKSFKDVPANQSFKKAIAYYTRIVETYPKSQEAPAALFMVGFIEANELNDYQSATRDYNLFLSKYPNHQLVTAVKNEIANMGVAPEDIISKKLANHK